MGRIRDAVKAYEVVCGGRRKKGWWEIVDAIADARRAAGLEANHESR